MIKASEGGGGKGIRKCPNESSFAHMYRQVEGEVPGSPIFIMKLANDCRHLEVQVLADEHGEAISLFGRDCSVQRRHQKIIEEAPVTICTDKELLSQMERCAVNVTKMVSYVSAGTVEYLYSPKDNEFYFLELNPRLQVEHPCTEFITNVNIPACQLQVAMGIPLHRIPDIRALYYEGRWADGRIDFEHPLKPPQPRGHVIGARITAENPEEGFKPAGGSLLELTFRSHRNVWGYFSVSSSGGLHEFADSQFGHVFAWGESRDRARQNLVVALDCLSIRGDFRTPINYLIKMVESEEFIQSTIHTRWLDLLIEDKKMTADAHPELVSAVCGTVHLANHLIEEAMMASRDAFERGHIGQTLAAGSVTIDFLFGNKKYFVMATKSGPQTFWLSMNNSLIEVGMTALSDGGTLVDFGETSHVTYMKEEVDKYRFTIGNKIALFYKEEDPSILRTTSPGKLVRYLVEDGMHVLAGTAYAEVEVMKMYMTLVTKESGVFQQMKSPGSVLEGGDVLGQLDLDDASKLRTHVTFSEPFPPEFSRSGKGIHSHQVFRRCFEAIQNILMGFKLPQESREKLIRLYVYELRRVLDDPELPLLEMREVLSTLHGRLPSSVEDSIHESLRGYEQRLGALFTTFPFNDIMKTIDNFDTSLQSAPIERATFQTRITPLLSVLSKYSGGYKKYARRVLSDLFTQYLSIETLFPPNKTELQVLIELWERHDKDVFAIAIAHRNHEIRTFFVLELLNWLASYPELTESEKKILVMIAELRSSNTSSVALEAKKHLMRTAIPSLDARRANVENQLNTALQQNEMDCYQDADKLNKVLSYLTNYLDIVPSFFYHPRRDFRGAALEIYARMTYAEHTLHRIRPLQLGNLNILQFTSVSAKHNKPFLGIIAPLLDLTELTEHLLEKMIKLLQEENYLRSLHIVVRSFDTEMKDDNKYSVDLLKFITDRFQMFVNCVDQLTFCLLHGVEPLYFTFGHSNNTWKEDTLLRHMEPGLAFQLELDRMSNYNITYIPTGGTFRQHLYFAVRREKSSQHEEQRIFIRCLVNGEAAKDNIASYWNYTCEKVIVEAISALEIVRKDKKYKAVDYNHLYINVAPAILMETKEVLDIIVNMLKKHGEKFYLLRIIEAEVICTCCSDGVPTRYRWFLKNKAGFFEQGASIKFYKQVSTTPVQLVDSNGQVKHLVPHKVCKKIQYNRSYAQLRGTCYVYDIPAAFKKTISDCWRVKGQQPSTVLDIKELQLDTDGNLVPKDTKEVGTNKVGMVVWRFTMYTPEYPEGRPAIVLANDLTFQVGSFSTGEDDVFRKGSEIARKEGIPRIYISVNSGARIGLAEEVKSKFKIAWKGSGGNLSLDYLYLTPEDHALLNKNQSVVNCDRIVENGEERYRITTIIGAKHGLGVENLRGSGMIAGETSRAYQETFTISLVSHMSVGIGAYLVRLGQRVIQVESSSILLTGSSALNKLLGSEVYSNNQQIGGPQIMYHNGISHLNVKSDFAGIKAIVKWLSYVPKSRFCPLPIVIPTDPIDREVGYTPTPFPYDPRWMLEGKEEFIDGEFHNLSGFFDKGSWTETLAGWAKNVVVGRARLGGIPVGVLAVEPRTTEVRVPADPASLNSRAEVVQQAGLVWFPNSAFKTAQAITDFNQERLPLIIFANWRGFSGGVRDMFGEILKYGSYIVDALVQYKQPVLSYIPPYGELRGGSWVVIDPTINGDYMEMYADELARGGVLEPDGTVEIKFKEVDLEKVMLRLDESYSQHYNEFKSKLEKETNSEARDAILSKFRKHKQELLPHYHQAALEFAKLHDTPGRMKAKKVIHDVVCWKSSRQYFYWRLCRRVLEERYVREIISVNGSFTHEEALNLVKSTIPVDRDEDRAVAEALSTASHLMRDKLQEMRTKALFQPLQRLQEEERLIALNRIVQSLGEKEKEHLRKLLE
eukprot:TRINITY_DN3153_c0_g1_i18.p1 TRINITY_DN3153_c0_g1~~TRINITY_DN3153_c0_g1_i18.p1  ORF type:complete len:1925 (+),score=392.40 TRINITY_DN3153_c0_g1_i18:882-6656(+)